jgi:hypothetical protein
MLFCLLQEREMVKNGCEGYNLSMGHKKSVSDWHEDEKDRINGERHAGIVIRDNKIFTY